MAFHWLIALAILGMLALGFFMVGLPPGSPRQFALYQLHKSIGITVLALSLLRLGWRLINPVPPMPTTLRPWERLAARATHAGFYLLMIGLPLTGWLMVSVSPWNIPTLLFGVVPLPHLPGLADVADRKAAEAAVKSVHLALAWGAIGLLLLHVGAALKHHLILKDDVLRRMLPASALLAAALVALPAAAAPSWTLVAAESRLGFVASQAGVPVEGQFRRYAAEIRFDPADLAQSQVIVSVDMASADTGNRQRDELLPGADWFDVARHPQARFETTSFREVDAGRFAADAALTIRGITLPVALPFSLTIDGPVARVKGETTIKRSAFGVGRGDWANPALVGDDVTVRIDITARRPQ